MDAPDTVQRLHQANRHGWNEAAQEYEAQVERDIEFLRQGGQNFCPPELDFLADLDQWCGRAVHLQCAGGTDTLSLWNRGAKEVVGIDISERMIACARAKSKALGAPASWHVCDVLEAPPELNGTADLVYTGRGALCWMMDIQAWADTAARLLKPGGRLYLFEGHPAVNVWDLNASTYVLDRDFGDYFQSDPILSEGWPDTYIGSMGKEEHPPKYEKMWRTDQILCALIDAGLTIRRVGEHPDTFWNTFPNIPPDIVRRLPQTLSVLAFSSTEGRA